MDFLNDTGWEARLFTGAIDDEQIGAWLVARATFEVDPSRGRLTPSAARWPVFHEKVDTRYGTFPSDNHPMHRGCDLVVLGRARCRQPVERCDASFSVGDFHRTIRVIGDRRWVRDVRGELVASTPTPFTEMPLDWSRAYGGRAESRGEPVEHPLNPQGRGVCLDEASAEGVSLPNLEDPSMPVATWMDSPVPAAWGPVDRSLPWQLGDRVKQEGWGPGNEPGQERFNALVRTCTPAASVPRNVAPELRGDERVRIALGDNRWDFALPGFNLRVDVQVGDERFVRRTSVSGLWFLADTQLLVVTFRSRWRYRMRPRETRAARLHAMSA